MVKKFLSVGPMVHDFFPIRLNLEGFVVSGAAGGHSGARNRIESNIFSQVVLAGAFPSDGGVEGGWKTRVWSGTEEHQQIPTCQMGD